MCASWNKIYIQQSPRLMRLIRHSKTVHLVKTCNMKMNFPLLSILKISLTFRGKKFPNIKSLPEYNTEQYLSITTVTMVNYCI